MRGANETDPEAKNRRVVNPFVGDVVATRYAQARPQLHHHVVALLAERVPTPDLAIDVGCGTGLSTEPLAKFARLVVGVDASIDMLRRRQVDGRALYVAAPAERLPFRDAAFDLATMASTIHWLGPNAIGEVGRVLRQPAWLVVYDVWFRAEMVGTDAFAQWMRDECGPRYPPVPKNEFTPMSVAIVGFAPAWEEELRFEVPMTINALAAYLMTHSERIAAVREGRETEAEQQAYLVEGLRPFYWATERRQLAFGIWVKAFSR